MAKNKKNNLTTAKLGGEAANPIALLPKTMEIASLQGTPMKIFRRLSVPISDPQIFHALANHPFCKSFDLISVSPCDDKLLQQVRLLRLDCFLVPVRSIDWLIDWFIHWWIDVNELIDWLIDWWIVWMIQLLMDFLAKNLVIQWIALSFVTLFRLWMMWMWTLSKSISPQNGPSASSGNTARQAQAAGKYFEICYRHTLGDEETRMSFFSNCRRLLVDLSPGDRGKVPDVLVLSSDVSDVAQMKSPLEVDFLCDLCGLPPSVQKHMNSQTARLALESALAKRRTAKSAIQIILWCCLVEVEMLEFLFLFRLSFKCLPLFQHLFLDLDDLQSSKA